MTRDPRSPSDVPDTVLVAYGLLAGGARMILPPVWDLPFLRTVRGSMFERIARAAGVTLTAEARRLLVDLDEPTTTRGIAQQAVRWAAGRFIPGAAVADAARNLLRTYAAGAIFKRYLDRHRGEPRDPVLSPAEAERVRKAIVDSVDVLSLDHVRAVTRLAMESVQRAGASREGSGETGLVQRYSDALVSAVAELPVTWVDVMDASFVARVKGIATP